MPRVVAWTDGEDAEEAAISRAASERATRGEDTWHVAPRPTYPAAAERGEKGECASSSVFEAVMACASSS